MKTALIILALSASVILMTLLSVDALEFEATGQCRDCLVLQYLRPGVER